MNARLLIASQSLLSEAWQPRSLAHLGVLRCVEHLSHMMAESLTSGTDNPNAQRLWEKALMEADRLACQERDPEAPRLPDAEARALFDAVDAAWLTWRAFLALKVARGVASRRESAALCDRRLAALRSALS